MLWPINSLVKGIKSEIAVLSTTGLLPLLPTSHNHLVAIGLVQGVKQQLGKEQLRTDVMDPR